MDSQVQVSRGHRAKEILTDPLIEEAFATIEKEMWNLWQGTQTDQKDQRENLFLTLRGMRLFKMHLESVLNTGKMAEHEIERLQNQSASGTRPSKNSRTPRA